MKDKEIIEIEQFLKVEALNRRQGKGKLLDREYYKLILLNKILEKLCEMSSSQNVINTKEVV